MNRMFRIIWSKALGTWVVTSELTPRHSKSGGDNGRCQALVASVGAATLAIGCWSSPASAQVWTGTTSSNWTVGSNWSTGTVPTGNVTFNTQTPNPTVLGVSGSATATIGNLTMGAAAGTSALTVQNGSTLSSSAAATSSIVGSVAGSNATLTVTGPGSTWSTTGTGTVTIGNAGTGTLNVANGGAVNAMDVQGVTFGNFASGTLNVTSGGTFTTTTSLVRNGTANVSGSGSLLNVGTSLNVGTINNLTGALNVQNGGAVTAGSVTIGPGSLSNRLATGTATITGAGSQLTSSGALNIGLWGRGTLTASNGAVVTANTVAMATGSAGRATFNLSSGGMLATQAMTAGAGTAQVNFDGASLRATASNGAFISGFTGTELNIASGGLTLDSAGFNVTATSPFTGVGALTKVGTGTATLAGSNTYSGGTTISAGTLQLGNGGTAGSIAGDVANNGTLAFDRSDTYTFGGQITGAGAVTQAGTGTTVLTGSNTYSGGTAINGGTLQVSSDANLGDANGALSLNGGTLHNTASFASARAVTLSAGGGTFQTTGDLTLAGTIDGAGMLTKTDAGTLLLTGNNTYSGGTAINGGTLQLGNGGASGSIAGDVANNGTLAIDRSDTVTLSAAVSGSGAVRQIGTGTTILSANNTYAGGTTIAAGTLAVGDASHPQATSGSGDISVASGATLGGYGQIAGSVQNNGTLAPANALPVFAAGQSGTLPVGGSVTNNGTLQLAAANGTPGNVLQVAGNYSGSGRLVLNTALDASGTASQSDRLVVGGNASGSTAISVKQSGTAAQTVGNGIELVQVKGTSSANSFRLAQPVQAGAYQYLLYQGGPTDANSWYLRSKLEQTTSAATSPVASAGPATATAAAPVAYRPAVVGYSVTPLLNTDYGFSVLGSLHTRVGDEASTDAVQPAHANGIWGRFGGHNLDADAGSRFSTDEHTFFAQFGKDWTLARDSNGGSTHAGATVTFGSTSASFSDNLRSITGQLSNATGTVETQAQSLGGYWTRYLPDGSYIDGVGQLTHYRNRYGDVYGGSASQNGFSAGVSGEAGKPLALGATGVVIEPQVQLLYQYLHLNHFDDGISQVRADSTNALRGRMGFRLFTANLWNDSKTSSVTPSFTADVLHDFFSPGQTNIGGTVLDNQLGKTWYELGVGLTGSFGKRSTLYADIRYAHSMGGEYRRTVFGQAGCRFAW